MPVAVGTKALLSLKSGRPPSGGGGGRGTLGCEAFLGRKVPAPTPSVRPATKSREGPRVGIFFGGGEWLDKSRLALVKRERCLANFFCLVVLD